MTDNLTPKANVLFRIGSWMDHASNSAPFKKMAVSWWWHDVMGKNMEEDNQHARQNPDEKFGNAVTEGMNGYCLVAGSVVFGVATPFQMAAKYGLMGGGKALKAMAKPLEPK